MNTEDKSEPLLPLSDGPLATGWDEFRRQLETVNRYKDNVTQIPNFLQDGKSGCEAEASVIEELDGSASSDSQTSFQQTIETSDSFEEELNKDTRKWASYGQLRRTVQFLGCHMVGTQLCTLRKLLALERAADPKFPTETFHGDLFDACEAEDILDDSPHPYLDDVVARFDFCKSSLRNPCRIPRTNDATLRSKFMNLYSKATLAILESRNCRDPMYSAWSARVRMSEADREASQADLTKLISRSVRQCREAHIRIQKVIQSYEDLRSEVSNNTTDCALDDGTKGSKGVEA